MEKQEMTVTATIVRFLDYTYVPTWLAKKILIYAPIITIAAMIFTFRRFIGFGTLCLIDSSLVTCP